MGNRKAKEIKISAFCLTTNNVKYQFPFIESIKSFLEVVDEMIIVDGGSTDGTVEAIQAIGDDRIKIIQDDDTKWEDDWTYWRMGHNFNRGLQECTGEWVLKFDTDYVLNERGTARFRGECLDGRKKNKLAIAFTRLNYITANKYYIKSKKTLAINKALCEKTHIDLRYGLDLKSWGFGYEFIDLKEYKHNINFGKIIRNDGNFYTSSLLVHNYDNVFATKEVVKEMRSRHWLAEEKQRAIICGEEFDGVDNSWNDYKKLCKTNLRKIQYDIKITGQPSIIQDKINDLMPEQQGYDCWGLIK